MARSQTLADPCILGVPGRAAAGPSVVVGLLEVSALTVGLWKKAAARKTCPHKCAGISKSVEQTGPISPRGPVQRNTEKAAA